jgi:branched-chain amino acid transport system permease protein
MFGLFERVGFSRAQAVGVLVLIVIVAGAAAGFYPIFLMQVMCFALFAMSTNLLLGFLGLLSLGQAAYFGLGAYVAGYAVKTWGLTPELAIALGGVGGAALGAAFGWLVIRRAAIAFAMITLALAQIADFVANEAAGFTGGENGIQGIPRGALFGVLSLNDDRAMYALVAVVFIAGVFFIHRVLHSPFGQIVKAIRVNEPRTISLGYTPAYYKWIVFILAGGVAGLAGGLKAIVMGIATLSDIGNALSGLVVLMVLLGGIGTVFGPIVGALVVVAMQYYLAPFGAWVLIIQGVIFIVCVLTFRRGVIGELGARFRVAL